MASGKVRIAFNSQNITCIGVTLSGISGPCFDIAKELAAQLRVQTVNPIYEGLDAVFEAGRRGEWDFAFMVVDPNESGIAFTPANLEIDQTYLVAGDSPFRSVSDLDRPGNRVAVFSPSILERYLRANLKNATVVTIRGAGIAQAAVLIETGKAEAYAGARSDLLADGWRLSGGRVLDDSITRNQWGIAVAGGRADLLAYATRFLENAGTIQDAINNNRLVGARVAR